MMQQRAQGALVAVYSTAGDARRAIEDLRAAHFRDADIGLLTHDKEGDPDVRSFKAMEGNRAGAGAAIGAAAGASGGALYALGIAAGLLPAIGPVIAGGLLLAVAASAASVAAAGALVGSLVGLGVPDVDAAYYEEEFKQGRTIVVVRDVDRRTLASSILRSHRPENQRQLRPETLAEQIETQVASPP